MCPNFIELPEVSMQYHKSLYLSKNKRIIVDSLVQKTVFTLSYYISSNRPNIITVKWQFHIMKSFSILVEGRIGIESNTMANS